MSDRTRMKPFPEELYRFLKAHTRVEVRVGADRETFTDIWVVAVDGHIFARSWNRSMNGWFGALVEGKRGTLRFGDRTLAIRGTHLPAASDLMPAIDQAYLKRFTQPENIPYAEGIAQPAFYPYTVEIVPDET